MNKANYLFFAVQILRRKSGVYILKVPQGDDEWNSKRRKETRGENPKNISVCEIHYSKYQLIKSMYKIITTLFLQKSHEAYRNSEDTKFYKVSYDGQFCKSRSLKLNKTLRTCSEQYKAGIFGKLIASRLRILLLFLKNKKHFISIHEQNSIFYWFSFK